jgi:hypothetical protein
MSVHYFLHDKVSRCLVKSNDDSKYQTACNICNELSNEQKYAILKGFFHDSVVGKINPRDMFLF